MNKFERKAAEKYVKDLILRKKSISSTEDYKRLEKLIEAKMGELNNE